MRQGSPRRAKAGRARARRLWHVFPVASETRRGSTGTLAQGAYLAERAGHRAARGRSSPGLGQPLTEPGRLERWPDHIQRRAANSQVAHGDEGLVLAAHALGERAAGRRGSRTIRILEPVIFHAFLEKPLSQSGGFAYPALWRPLPPRASPTLLGISLTIAAPGGRLPGQRSLINLQAPCALIPILQRLGRLKRNQTFALGGLPENGQCLFWHIAKQKSRRIDSHIHA